MLRFIARRSLTAVPVLIIVSMMTYAGLELAPGDPIDAYIGNPALTVVDFDDEDIARLKREYGLDGPIHIRYLNHMGRILHGDFGRSLTSNLPVTEAIKQRLSVSLWLSGVTLLMSIAVGVTLGALAGVRPGSKTDLATTFIAVSGVAAPSFWIAIFLILIFSVNLGWLPASGWSDPLDDPSGAIKHMILPVMTLGLAGTAAIMRQTRSAVVEVMAQDFIRTALAKGLTNRTVVLRHALKNAMLPVVTIMGLQVSVLFGGSVLIERVFAIPGVGRLALDATNNSDFPLLQGIVLVVTVAVIAGNLLADLAYAILDPRIRYQ